MPILLAALTASLFAIIAFVIRRIQLRDSGVIAFFHPFCLAGGGGERVLWAAIESIQRQKPDVKIVIYTEDTEYIDEIIISKAKDKFSIPLRPSGISFVRLKYTWLMRDSSYPRLTLFMQSIGSILLGLEACLRYRPATVVDTIGCAFAYPAFFLSGSRVIAYVHYPFISDDMIDRVRRGAITYNNSNTISQNIVLTGLKLAYYRVILWAYQLCGLFANTAMVNSRWTAAHMARVWPKSNISLVYPPCDIENFVPLKASPRKRQIVSLAQFRPEKGHELQLEAFAKMKNRQGVTLILAGGARNDEDRNRVACLKQRAQELKIDDQVRFEVEITFQRIKELLNESLIGLHTMVDEHFGISIVEFMAAGLITVANDSGGPRSDIIDDGKNGYRASSTDRYALILDKILALPEEECELIRKCALEKVRKQFTVEQFGQRFVSAL